MLIYIGYIFKKEGVKREINNLTKSISNEISQNEIEIAEFQKEKAKLSNKEYRETRKSEILSNCQSKYCEKVEEIYSNFVANYFGIDKQIDFFPIRVIRSLLEEKPKKIFDIIWMRNIKEKINGQYLGLSKLSAIRRRKFASLENNYKRLHELFTERLEAEKCKRELESINEELMKNKYNFLVLLEGKKDQLCNIKRKIQEINFSKDR